MRFKDKDVQNVSRFEDEVNKIYENYRHNIEPISRFSSSAVAEIVSFRNSVEKHAERYWKFADRFGLEGQQHIYDALEILSNQAEEKLAEGIEIGAARIRKYNQQIKNSKNISIKDRSMYSKAIDEEIKTLYDIYLRCNADQKKRYKGVIKSASKMPKKNKESRFIGYIKRRINRNLAFYIMLNVAALKTIKVDKKRKSISPGYAVVYQLKRDYLMDNTNMMQSKEDRLREELCIYKAL